MEQNDQRNMMLAIVLMIVLMFTYSTFVLEPQARTEREARARAQAEQAAVSPAPSLPLIRSKEDVLRNETAAGERVLLDAPAVDGSISLVGARIDDVSLKGFYETIDDKLNDRIEGEVQLLAPEGTDRAFYAVVNWTGAPGLPTEADRWTREGEGALSPDNPLQLRWDSGAVSIRRKIAIDDNYMFVITDTLTNSGGDPLSVQAVAALRQRLQDDHLRPPPQAHAGVIGVYGEKKNQMVKYADLNKGRGVVEEANSGWIGLTTKYWMAAAIPEQGEPVSLRASVDKANGQTTFLAGYSATPYTIAPGGSITKTTRIFAGAKRVSTLEVYEKDAGIPSFTDAVDWSWLWFITKPFFWTLATFQGWFGSFGLAILALTVCVKTLFFPIQFKVYESMSKLRKLQPEMEAIRERFGADRARQQQEILKLYQREKANPLAGCLPLIPQAIVFYALYHTLMVALEMRHTPFYGWVLDMSAPDPTTIFNLFGLIPWDPRSIPLIGGFLMIGAWPILYGATMYLLQGMSAPPTDPTQKMIMQFLPLIFLLLFAGFAAGLVIYWTWSNIITIVQQYLIMRKNGVETEFDKFLKKRLGAGAQ
jgi:YidC/Oxa1 family membrane protein insertase